MLLGRLSCLAAALVGTAIAATPAQWRSQSIYFMLTDRFARSDGSTDAECDATMGRYCGGTWKGITDKLDYIQGMGFTAVWITPVTGQLPQNTSEGSAYHGYWQQDLYSLNEHYGTANDLKELAKALHDRGMYLMVDVVANHFGYNGPGDKVDYSVFKPFNNKKYFHPYCQLKDYNNVTEMHDCWMGDKVVSLADVNTDRQDVQDMYYKWIGSLVSNYSIDGLRIDTVRQVPKKFWSGFNKAAGVYCVGEVFDGDAELVGSYQKEALDGVLNYPMYYPIVKAFKSTKGDMNNLYNKINSVKSSLPDTTLMGSFIENHDNPRFASYTKDKALGKNAAAFSIMADGIPIVYAGQEQQFSGAKDPENREALWTSGYNTKSELYTLIGKANGIRNHAIKQNKNYVTSKNYPIYKDDTTVAMRKGNNGTQTITVLSNLGANGKKYTLSLPKTGFQAGTSLKEVITCADVKVGKDGKVPVPMESGGPRILYPSSELKDAKVCSS